MKKKDQQGRAVFEERIPKHRLTVKQPSKDSFQQLSVAIR
jgi:hypothetical protein